MSEAVTWICSVQKLFLKISQNSQENICARISFFNKTAGLRPATLFKKTLWHRSFEACNFIKKEILAQVFPRKFFKISKNNFLYRTPSMAASQVAWL